MAYEIVRSRDSVNDLDVIFDHLIESYINLGDPPAEAVNRAADRIREIRADMDTIASAPFQGTILTYMAAGLRSVTKNKAVFYFDVDGPAEIVNILAVFFGDQDHRRHMLKRLGRMD